MDSKRARYSSRGAVTAACHPVLKRGLSMVMVVLLMASALFAAVCSQAETANADFVKHMICTWGWPKGADDEGADSGDSGGDGDKDLNDPDEGQDDVKKVLRPALIYELSQTDDLPYMTLFKSQVGAEAGDVKSNLGNTLSGKDYEKVNLDILNNANATEKKYTPYDRFGFAGLKWSAYQGEWNWIKVYYCGADNHSDDEKDPEDKKINLYYDGRNRPLDTWEDRAASKDPRVQLKAVSPFFTYSNNLATNVANFLFWFTKLVVGFNNMLIEKSMSNVARDLGFTATSQGIMTNLLNTLYWQLVALALVVMAGSLIWTGIAKRRYREVFTELARAVMVMVLALAMIAAPALFVELPNAVGVLAQYSVMSLTSSTITAGRKTDMCSTENEKNVEIKKDSSIQLFQNGKINEDALTKWMDDLGDKTGRALSCQYWNLFALTPWSLGQFGTTPDNLYAKGKAGDGQHDIGYSFKTGAEGTQGDYPGLAAVPLGNKQAFFNWAVYQLSVQSNSHISSSVADPKTGEIKDKPQNPYDSVYQFAGQSRLIDDTYGDWWRVVDAVSGWDTLANADSASSSEAGGMATEQGIDGAIKWAQKTAQDPAHGYDQTHRLGPDYDCSSFVSTALKEAGFGVNVFSTANEVSELEKAGFKKVEGANLSTGEGLKPGDVLFSPVHTEFYIGNGTTLGAHWNENHGITGGATGDQHNDDPNDPEIGPGKLASSSFTAAYRYGDGGTVTVTDGSGDSQAAYTQKPGAVKTDWWSTWIGANSFYRQSIAAMSLVACLALILPIALGFTVIAASIASVVLMAAAPMVLALSLIPHRGQAIFSKWLNMLWGTVVRRTVISIVYVLVLVVTTKIMGSVIGLGNYLKSIILLLLFTWTFLRFKDKIIDVFMQRVGNPGEQAVSRKMGNISKTVNNYTTAAAVGALAEAKGHKVKTPAGETVRNPDGSVKRVRIAEGNKKGEHYGNFKSIMASAAKGAGSAVKNQALVDMQRTKFGRLVNQNIMVAQEQQRKSRMMAAGMTDDEIQKAYQTRTNDVNQSQVMGGMMCQAPEHDENDSNLYPTSQMREVDGVYVCPECYNNYYQYRD